MRRDVVRVCKKNVKKGQIINCEGNIIVFFQIFIFIDGYLLPVVQLADEQIEEVEVAAVEEQVDEAKHGRGAHHRPRQVGQPHHGLDDPHGDQVEARQRGDHRIPLRNQRQVKTK